MQFVASDLETATKEAWSARALAEASAGEVDALTGQMNELDALITGAVERLALLEREEHAADRERAVLAGRSVEVEERLAVDSEKLGAVEVQLGKRWASITPSIPGGPGRDGAPCRGQRAASRWIAGT